MCPVVLSTGDGLNRSHLGQGGGLRKSTRSDNEDTPCEYLRTTVPKDYSEIAGTRVSGGGLCLPREYLRGHDFPTGHVRQGEKEDLSETEDSLPAISI